MKESESEIAQSCPTLCNPMDCSLSGSSVHGIFQQECWSGLPFPSPGDLPDPGIEPGSPALQADALPSEPPGKPQKRILILLVILIKWFLLVRHQHLGPRVWNCRRHLVNNLFSFLSHRITSMTIKYGPNSEMKKGWDEVTEEIQYQ